MFSFYLTFVFSALGSRAFCLGCFSRKDKKYLAAHAPERAGVSTVAVIDKFKGTRNKRKLLATVGYREPPAAKQHALQKSEGDRTVDGAKVPVVKKSPQSRKGKGVPA